MKLVDALYVNNSGGLTLLRELILRLGDSRDDVHFLLDARCEGRLDAPPGARTTFLKASLYSRAEFYQKHRAKLSHVLCFGNQPPLLRLPQAAVATYFHNTAILEPPRQLTFAAKAQLHLRRLFIRTLRSHTNVWFVQSPNVRAQLKRGLGINPSQTEIAPFFPQIGEDGGEDVAPNETLGIRAFLYPATGVEHKNHTTLIRAWKLLAQENRFPVLHLTIECPTSEQSRLLDDARAHGALIQNHGTLPFSELQTLYTKARAVVFPSLTESFGLPLIEAVQLGCQVIAADLPYVHEVIIASATFDPLNERSLAAAISLALDGALPQSSCRVANEISKLVDFFS